jgi:predicted RNA binding protein YcfA (HicA-like mRNA interferase family)
MSRLPGLRPRQIISALENRGFVVSRIAGSHYQLYNKTSCRHVTVPYHNRDLPRGTVAAIVKQAGLTRVDFLDALR